MNADKSMKDIDIICLIGTLTKDEKAKFIRLFIHGSDKHPEIKLRLLCATSGVGNAGIDCPDVRAVYRIDFPPSILDLAQEKGRAGRTPGASPDDFHYIICYSLETYLYLFKRILNPAEEYINPSYRQTQIHDVLEVAKVLISPYHCISLSLEYLMGSPETHPDDHTSPPCGVCTNCTQKKSQFEPISRQGVTKVLLDLFISSSEEMIFTLDNTVKYIKEYRNSQKLIFGTKRRKYEPLRIKKMLFQLLTYEIITVVFSERLNKILFQLARLPGENALDISINCDHVWECIETIESNHRDGEVDGKGDGNGNGSGNGEDSFSESNNDSDSDSDSECDLRV
jgi:superfamily II DNA helicase RecQ